METIRVLLVCGSGASSGFMAANIRKAAAARGLNLSVTARSESEIENYVDEIDVLMVGPHLAYIVDEVDDYVGDRPIAVILMSPDYYSTLDGDLAVDHLISTLTDEDA
ncbi:PTS sugar transporter subunit IIB [Micropruina sp.]|uniref:PTS sugar transporter subunit IIB n=1 Tax=Micropruina sp. TaxID=2737536 RepID=UPI002604F108|nr:PTS sugar transporter subunit IIB [Micropruina sp.]